MTAKRQTIPAQAYLLADYRGGQAITCLCAVLVCYEETQSAFRGRGAAENRVGDSNQGSERGSPGGARAKAFLEQVENV
jgi:hypothetical protein